MTKITTIYANKNNEYMLNAIIYWPVAVKLDELVSSKKEPSLARLTQKRQS